MRTEIPESENSIFGGNEALLGVAGKAVFLVLCGRCGDGYRYTVYSGIFVRARLCGGFPCCVLYTGKCRNTRRITANAMFDERLAACDVSLEFLDFLTFFLSSRSFLVVNSLSITFSLDRYYRYAEVLRIPFHIKILHLIKIAIKDIVRNTFNYVPFELMKKLSNLLSSSCYLIYKFFLIQATRYLR